MKLILIRHADAAREESRELTENGRRQQTVVADALRRMGITFERLLSSPLLRALQTAELTARVVGFREPVEETPALGDAFTVEGLLERLATLPAEATVACIGHEPYLGRFAAALVTPDGNLSIEVKKSGVIGIQTKGRPARGNGTLLFVLRPDELAQL